VANAAAASVGAAVRAAAAGMAMVPAAARVADADSVAAGLVDYYGKR
jgi:hypothetical protein